MEKKPEEKKKRSPLPIIIIVIIVILGLLVAGYFLFLKDSESPVANVINEYLPFGGPTPDTDVVIDPNTDTSGRDDIYFGTDDEDFELPRFFQITDEPTAGMFYKTLADGSRVVRYMAKQNAHVYDFNLNDFNQNKIVNTTIPSIYETYWGRNGQTAIIRYLEDDNETIKTYVADVVAFENTATGTNQTVGVLEGSFLADNITQVAPSRAGDQVFYLVTPDDLTVGATIDITNTFSTSIFSSPLSEWLAEWQGQNVISLTTKPSATIPGYMFFLHLDSKELETIIPNKEGLTTLTSPGGTRVLYSQNNVNNQVELHVYDVVKRESRILPLPTFPEKCAWSVDDETVFCGIPDNIPGTNYPDKWYQGLVSLSDGLWKVNTTSGGVELLGFPQGEVGEQFDIIRPITSTEEDLLFFINKKDDSLWGARLDSLQKKEEKKEEVDPGYEPGEDPNEESATTTDTMGSTTEAVVN